MFTISKLLKNKFISIDNNVLTIKNKNSDPLITFKIDESDIIINVHKGLQLTIDGELNMLNNGDINIESWKSILNLNSRIAKQIKDLPESIEFRKNYIKFMDEHNKLINKHKDTVEKIETLVVNSNIKKEEIE